MINLLKNVGLIILVSFPMIFAADRDRGVELSDEGIFEPRPDNPGILIDSSCDIATSLECLPCTANRKEFFLAKNELVNWMGAIELTDPSAIAIRAMLKKGVQDAYADPENNRDYGDTCMLALAARVDRDIPDLNTDIGLEVTSSIAAKLRTFLFTAEEFSAAKVELLSKLMNARLDHTSSKTILGVLRDSIKAI